MEGEEAVENFDFHVPTKLIFGRDTVPRIGAELARDRVKKVLLIAGGGSIKKNGVYERTVRSLEEAGIERLEVWGVRPNPVLSKVREMIDLARQSKIKAVLAVGGGSVIDSAKAVAAGICMGEDVWRLFEKKEPVTQALPIYSVLTISATGTEMDPYAVVTNEEEKKKWNIAGPALYPRVSILDPSVQATLPWDETVNGALDALSHIMEQYFMGGDSETTLALNESLSRSIIRMTDRLQSDPKNYEARANLAWAATLALNGISQAGQGTGDWATHGMEHGLSALYPEIAHGAGLGVLFPAWIHYCQNVDTGLFRRWAQNIWDADSVENGIRAMRGKIKSWGHPTALSELGVPESRIREIARNTVLYGMTGNAKTLTEEDIVHILKLASPQQSSAAKV